MFGDSSIFSYFPQAEGGRNWMTVLDLFFQQLNHISHPHLAVYRGARPVSLPSVFLHTWIVLWYPLVNMRRQLKKTYVHVSSKECLSYEDLFIQSVCENGFKSTIFCRHAVFDSCKVEQKCFKTTNKEQVCPDLWNVCQLIHDWLWKLLNLFA